MVRDGTSRGWRMPRVDRGLTLRGPCCAPMPEGPPTLSRRDTAETDSAPVSRVTARKKAKKMPLLRCQDPECGHEWPEASRLAEGADCIECGGPTALVDRDDDSDIEEEVSKTAAGRGGPRFAYARNAAQALLRRHEIEQLPVPVEEIADRVGLAIVESTSLGSNIRGRLVEDVIEIASGDSAAVKRFSIAHELAHHSMGTVHNQGRKEEREADAFASELLVPRDKLREYFKQTTDLRELARRFFVSQQVMRIAIDHSNKGRGR